MLYGLAYYLIYNKHHKRNKVELHELIGLVTQFYSTTLLTIVLLAVGTYFICSSVRYKYDRFDVITSVSLGIFINIIVIFNYISYIKRSLKDYDPVVREESKKRTMKIGEIIELIIIIGMLIYPFFKIQLLIDLYKISDEFIIELLKTITIPIIAVFLFFNLNLFDIKNKLENRKNRKHNK